MIKITVEIFPHGDVKTSQVVGTAFICNDGTGNTMIGNYKYTIFNTEISKSKNKTLSYQKLWKEGSYKDYIRVYGIWYLLFEILRNIFNENKIK